MAGQTSAAFTPPPSSLSSPLADYTIPAPLKFLISNLKTLVPTQLIADNYAIWRLQLLQHFTANGFAGHLSGATPCPAEPSHPDFASLNLVDKNLISALLSTISPSILPYVISSSTAQEVWTVLERRLQSSSQSQILQLKNELHHIQLKNSSMQQYLTQIKTIVDTIAASGSVVDPEDIILHTLNGLPSYNSFKAAICTSQLPLDLDTLYSLLCNEEIHVQQEVAWDNLSSTNQIALLSAPPLFVAGITPDLSRTRTLNLKLLLIIIPSPYPLEAIRQPAPSAKFVANPATLQLTVGTDAILNTLPLLLEPLVLC